MCTHLDAFVKKNPINLVDKYGDCESYYITKEDDLFAVQLCQWETNNAGEAVCMGEQAPAQNQGLACQGYRMELPKPMTMRSCGTGYRAGFDHAVRKSTTVPASSCRRA